MQQRRRCHGEKVWGKEGDVALEGRFSDTYVGVDGEALVGR